MSFHIQSSEKRVQKVTSAFPAPHLVAPQLGERFLSREEAKKHFQNWAFTQGVALVVESNSLSRGYYILECTRHHMAAEKKELKLMKPRKEKVS